MKAPGTLKVRAVAAAAITLTMAVKTTAAPVPSTAPDWDALSGPLFTDTIAGANDRAAQSWFPEPIDSSGAGHSYNPAETPSHLIARNERTVIPLPAAGWTGLTGLIGLACFRTRKMIQRFIR